MVLPQSSLVVIPTKVGIQKRNHWIPASAGMTNDDLVIFAFDTLYS